MACPDPEVLAAMAEGRLKSAERDALLDHAAGCDDCRHALLILGAPRPTAVRNWVPWAAAAAFILAYLGLLYSGREVAPKQEEHPAARTTPPRREPERPEPPKPVEAPKPVVVPKREEPAPLIPAPLPPTPTPEKPPAPEEPAPVKPPPAPEVPRPATVTVVALIDRFEGDVAVLSGATRTPAKAGQEIRQGDGVECRGLRSWALLVYPDRTRLEVEGDGLVREMVGREPGKGWRLLVEKGAVRAEVSQQPAGQAMLFRTPHGDARVIGTTLRVQVDPDPRKGTHLEVEEGKVELVTPAGKTALVEAGHFAVAAAGVLPALKRLPKEELLLSLDLEDGKKPALITKGTVERGPERRLCIAGEADAAGGCRLHLGDDAGLFTSTGEELLSFDYWADPQAGAVSLSLWNRTQKQPHEGGIPKLVAGKWTRVSLRLAEVGDPGTRLKEGDWAVSLLLQATGGARRFYVDNLTITRPGRSSRSPSKRNSEEIDP
ncbi:MAG: FecR domain-containing protein [Planctomycetes bacterium]|nr:FecR domain-containing protein [Planctomycetota bacterium]